MMTNAFDARQFTQLDDVALEQIEGGLFPLVIGGIVITKGMALGAGAVVAGLGVGYLVNRR